MFANIGAAALPSMFASSASYAALQLQSFAATNYNGSFGGVAATDVEGNPYVGSLTNAGGYLRYDGVQPQWRNLSIQVDCTNSGAQILIRTNSPTGPVIGTINVPVTRGPEWSYTDLVITNTTAQVASAKRHFNIGWDARDEVGKTLVITGGTGFTPGTYTITAIDTNFVATLNSPVGTVGSKNGQAALLYPVPIRYTLASANLPPRSGSPQSLYLTFAGSTGGLNLYNLHFFGTQPSSWLPTVTLNIPDAAGTSSFNAAGNWSNSQAPSATNNYLNTVGQLATPADGLDYVFLGNSLAISNGALLSLKGTSSSASLTVTNLILQNGGIISQDMTNVAGAYTANLNGSIMLLGRDNTLRSQAAVNGVLNINSVIGGAGSLTIAQKASGASGTLNTFLNAANTFAGGTFLSASNLANEAAVSLTVTCDGGLGVGTVTVSNLAVLTLTNGVANAYINNQASSILVGSPTVNLNFNGTNTIYALSFDGGSTYASAGTWGSSTSGAANTSSLFKGSGVLQVNPSNAPPTILLQPASQMWYATQTGQFNVVATGNPALTYQWQVGTNGIYVNLSDGGNFSGTATPTLTINNVAVANAADYVVVLTSSSFGSITSSIATLTVTAVSTNSLVWNGVHSAAWDTTTQNWTNQLGLADYYTNFEAVRFDDKAASTAVTLAGTVMPASVIFSNTVNAYSLSGAGGISGFTSLTKQGANSLTLSTSNSYTGGTTLSAGTLNLNHAMAIGATASTLTISGVNTLNNTSAGAITLANNNAQNWNADFTFAGTQGLNMGSGPVTLGGNRQVTVNGANALTVLGIISDGGNGYSITKAGGGQLTLGQFSTYSGGTIVNGGILTFGQTSGLGTGPVTINAATLYVGSQNITNPMVLNGGTVRNLSAVQTFTANGGVNLTANSSFVLKYHDTTEFIVIATTKMTGVGGFTLSEQNNVGGTAGSPVLLFSVPCDYAGNSTITSGCLRMNTANALPFGGGKGMVILNGAAAAPVGTLDLNGFNTSIDGLSGTASTVLGTVMNGSGTAATLTVGHGNTNSTFSGTIVNGTGPLALAKTGAGTFTLGGANTYTGATTVSNGTLLVNGVIGTNTVTVQTNGTLGGAGTVGGKVIFNTGSHAVLTLGSTLKLTNSLIVNAGVDVHLILSNNVPVGTNTLATYNVTGSSGTFTAMPVIDSGSLAVGTAGTIVTSGGLVRLQVTAAAPSTPPNFPPGGVSILPGGGISLVATGAVGGTYRLWATTNMALTPVTTTWTLLQGGTITASPFTNIDLTATNKPQQFYLFSTP
jgi:autotransporter-associated beta strand protein